jgi:hypothetical protein
MIGREGDRVTSGRDRNRKSQNRYFNRSDVLEIAEPTGISVSNYFISEAASFSLSHQFQYDKTVTHRGLS